MAEVKAIETAYKGYRFRSRLEARWAVFFDALGVKWEYEKEGYDLGEAGWYLPDFWLPEQEAWVEIKGAAPSEEEDNKAAALASLTGYKVYIFGGAIPDPKGADDLDAQDGTVWFPNGGWDNGQMWCICPMCGKVGIHFQGWVERLCDCSTAVSDETKRACAEVLYGRSLLFGAPRSTADAPPILTAYATARSARFEHGEQG